MRNVTYCQADLDVVTHTPSGINAHKATAHV